jgi:hypothetical protein
MVVRVLLAIVVALGVPVSQLQMSTSYVTCCCPDPANCHCPDHKPDHSKSSEPKMRACHRVHHDLVSPEAPTVAATASAIADAPMRPAPGVVFPLYAPHAPPAPADPDGPS